MELDKNIIQAVDDAMTSLQGELFNDSCLIIDQAQANAYRSVNEILIKRNWLLGMPSMRFCASNVQSMMNR